MWKKFGLQFIILLIFLLIFTSPLIGQDEGADEDRVTVPDVRRMTVAQAAAVLNRVGLRLGEQISGGLGDSANANFISDQTPIAGAIVEPGSIVSVEVRRDINILILYDDNDLTIVNQSNDPISVDQVVLRSVGGRPNATFNAREWAVGWERTLRPRQCLQIWSVPRDGWNQLPECQFIQEWRSTTNAADHFWTGSNGATEFAIIQDGILRGMCPVGGPSCELYLAPGEVPIDTSEYVYFTYDANELLLINQSADRWLPAAAIQLGGSGLVLGDTALFEDDVIGDVRLLAPGQCLQFYRSAPATESEPLERCDVIASVELGRGAFWENGFMFTASISGSARTCPSVIGDGRSICLVPR